jgi:toxin CcdB
MRFDVYRIPAGGPVGYLLDVQAELLSNLQSTVVVPLLPAARHLQMVQEMNPVFEFAGEKFVMATHEIASIQRRRLQRPVTSLAAHRDEITRALDILLTGF